MERRITYEVIVKDNTETVNLDTPEERRRMIALHLKNGGLKAEVRTVSVREITSGPVS